MNAVPAVAVPLTPRDGAVPARTSPRPATDTTYRADPDQLRRSAMAKLVHTVTMLRGPDPRALEPALVVSLDAAGHPMMILEQGARRRERSTWWEVWEWRRM